MNNPKDNYILIKYPDGTEDICIDASTAARIIGCSKQLISMCLSEKHYNKTAKGCKVEYVPISFYVPEIQMKEGVK